ncbi:MAG: hypothetical protein QXD72_03175, partial [Candidatus Aenigmatarchaeota archaeon]
TYPKLDHYQVYEINTFNNRFVILLMPTEWRYEFLEAFIHVLGKEEVLFSDFEFYQGRKDYASIGGCYYSTRLAIMEKLEEMKMQAGAIVFRESYPGYIPTGVWLVRECVREALRKIPAIFFDMNSALSYISSRLWLPISRYKQQSILLGQNLLSEFVR